MKRNSRFSLALHTHNRMAADPEKPQISREIANHASKNPVVVRRILGNLREAGLIASKKGHYGGRKLAQTPKNSTSAVVYTALDEQFLMFTGCEDEYRIPAEQARYQKVSRVIEETERVLIARLADMSIANVHSSERPTKVPFQ